MAKGARPVVERVQTGVRMEKRLLKVLKALAELHDMTLGDLLEGVVLHAFEGKRPFSKASLKQIAELKRIYQLDLSARDSHRLTEPSARAQRERSESRSERGTALSPSGDGSGASSHGAKTARRIDRSPSGDKTRGGS